MGGYQGKEDFFLQCEFEAGVTVLEHGASLYFRPLLPPCGIVPPTLHEVLTLHLPSIPC